MVHRRRMLKDVAAALVGQFMTPHTSVDRDWGAGVLLTGAGAQHTVVFDLLGGPPADASRAERLVCAVLRGALHEHLALRRIPGGAVAVARFVVAFDSPDSDGLSRVRATAQIEDDHGHTHDVTAVDVVRPHLEHRRRSGR